VAFVDVETTGCAPGRHRIIDVAVIGARNGEVEFEWQTLVNPGAAVSAGTTALTGIDNDMLADAPSFEQIAAELRAHLAGRVFVAHNVRFDYGFIRREFARLETSWRAPSLCTVRLSRALFPEMSHHNLDAVMERHGFTIEKRHRAMPDAQVLWMLWRKLRAEIAPDEFQCALERWLFRETKQPDDVGHDRFAEFEVPVTGVRFGRRNRNRHEVLRSLGVLVRARQDAHELLGIGDEVIRRQTGDRARADVGLDREAGERDRGRGVAARGLGDHILRPQLREMLEALLGVLLGRRDEDVLRRKQALQPIPRQLDQRLPVEDAEELLRVLVGAQRTESRARPAGKDQRRHADHQPCRRSLKNRGVHHQ
jgi:DNA polymerase III epsilon subunit family exonuclease